MGEAPRYAIHPSRGRAIPCLDLGPERVLRFILSRDLGAARQVMEEEVRRVAGVGVNLDEAVRLWEALDEAVLDALGREGLDPPELLDCAKVLQGFASARNRVLVDAYARCREDGEDEIEENGEAEGDGVGSASPPREGFLGLVGACAPMRRLYDRIELASRGRETVLVVGESGVGKELVARAIHLASGDAPHRFVPVNCAALPRDLVESELFGHRRGAFSGAFADHAGLVKAASLGTILLDEVCELPPDTQAKLLRVIQEKAVRGVGELCESRVEVRILASMNRPIAECLKEGRLRRDLYYRLQRMVIEVPPLRERLEDVPTLVGHFVSKWRETYEGGAPARFTSAAVERLASCAWPGNVRELENVVFQTCSSARGSVIDAGDLPLLEEAPAPALPRPFSLEEAEGNAIRNALERTRGNKARASRLLGISRKQLYVKLRLHGIEI